MNLEAACGWPTASNSRQKEFGVGDSYSQGNYETWGYPIYGHLQLLRHGSLEKARASGALPLLYIRTPPLPPKHFFFHHHILKHTHNPSKQTTQTIKMETIKVSFLSLSPFSGARALALPRHQQLLNASSSTLPLTC